MSLAKKRTDFTISTFLFYTPDNSEGLNSNGCIFLSASQLGDICKNLDKSLNFVYSRYSMISTPSTVHRIFVMSAKKSIQFS